MRFVTDPAVMKFRPLLSLLLATPAWAQSTDLLPKRLDELVVTASPLDRTLFELVQPAAVLKEK